MTLKWHKEKKVFQSEKYDAIPVGSHDVSMIIAGREVKVEPLDVKFYTFEADVYLLEGWFVQFSCYFIQTTPSFLPIHY